MEKREVRRPDSASRTTVLQNELNLYGTVDDSCFVQGFAAEGVTGNNPFTCWVIRFGRRNSQRLYGKMPA